MSLDALVRALISGCTVRSDDGSVCEIELVNGEKRVYAHGTSDMIFIDFTDKRLVTYCANLQEIWRIRNVDKGAVRSDLMSWLSSRYLNNYCMITSSGSSFDKSSLQVQNYAKQDLNGPNRQSFKAEFLKLLIIFQQETREWTDHDDIKLATISKLVHINSEAMLRLYTDVCKVQDPNYGPFFQTH